jgi:hypothetical protein
MKDTANRTLLALALGLGAGGCRSDARANADDSAEPVPQQVTIGDINWFVDYDAALASAREQDKALWVHFGENPG